MRQLASIYRDGSLIRDALAAAQEQAIREQPSLAERRRSIDSEAARVERSVERYFESFEQGRLSPERCEQRVAGLQARLDDLGGQQAELAESDDDGSEVPTADDLAAIVGQLETLIRQERWAVQESNLQPWA